MKASHPASPSSRLSSNVKSYLKLVSPQSLWGLDGFGWEFGSQHQRQTPNSCCCRPLCHRGGGGTGPTQLSAACWVNLLFPTVS